MPKPIKITQSLSEQLVEEFIEALKKYKLSDGKLTYSRQMTYDKKDVGNVNVCFTTQAFAKMVTLLHGFSTEVGWHGVVDRVEPDKFVISDILVYPQIVTGVTVDQDQEASQKWYMEYMKTQDEDGIFPRIRMQGHSHVNMGVTPSSTDEGFYADILKMVPDNDYYIFMIFNKRLTTSPFPSSRTAWIQPSSLQAPRKWSRRRPTPRRRTIRFQNPNPSPLTALPEVPPALCPM